MVWNTEICNKYKEWNKNNSNKLPSIIRQEYLRIFRLLAKGQVYGAFIQIKDTFEIVIKTSVITIASEILNKHNVSDEENDIIFKLFEKPLALGDWETINRLFKNKSEIEDVNTLNNGIQKIFSKNNITKWRNDYIGHGALSNSESEEFVNDIKEKIKILHKYFAEQLSSYGMIDYIIKDAIVTFTYNDICKFKFDNFIIYKDNKIYIFDSYISKKRKTSLLNYSDGIKIELEYYSNIDLVNKLQYDNTKRCFKSNVDNTVFSVVEDSIIKHLKKVDDFVRPEFIVLKINDFINNNEKGVLLIKMKRGMGKSTLAYALDPHGLDKIKLSNCVVRVYYTNDTYKSTKSFFSSEINDLFRIDKEGKVIYRNNLPYLDRSKENLRFELSSLLSFYKELYFNDLNKEKLIFIVDGLDEIVLQEDGSIFDFLPNEDDLNEGVYVIYTSRTNMELSNSYYSLSNINRISYTDIIEVDNESIEYKEMLRKFLKKKFNSIQSEMIEDYIEKSSSNFQYLRRVSNVLHTNKELCTKKIFTNEYYECEIENILNKFGNKYFNRIIDILLLYAIFEEPINLKYISQLLVNQNLSLELLFTIIQLRPFLSSERTLYGNCIFIADHEFRRFLKEKFPKRITENSNHLIKMSISLLEIKDEMDSYIQVEDSIIFILSNLESILELSDIEKNVLQTDNVIKRLLDIEARFSRNDLGSLKRLSKLQNQISELLDSTKINKDEYKIFKAILESNEAEVDDLLGFTAKANKGYIESVKKLNRVKIEERPFAMMLSSKTYVKYALLCIKLDMNDMAIISLDNALKLYEGLEKIDLWKPNLEDYLYIYNNKGIAYQNLEKYIEAELEYNKAVKMLEGDFKNYNDDIKLKISMLYLNRGVFYIKMGKEYFQKALNDLEDAYMLINSNNEIFSEQEAKILLNKSKIFYMKNDDDKALEVTNKAIEILENMKQRNKLIEDEIMIKAYNNKGVILNNIGQYLHANDCFNTVVSLGIKLKSDNRYVNNYELVKAHILLALNYEELEKLDDAFEIYKKIINSTKLKEKGLLILYLTAFNNYISLVDNNTRLLDISFITNMFDELLTSIVDDLTSEESRLFYDIIGYITVYLKENAMYNKAIEYQKLLLSLTTLLPNNNLIKLMVMKEIADCFVNQKLFSYALEYYDKSIAIIKKNNENRVGFIKEYSELLYNKSVIHMLKKQYQEAYDNAYESLDITNECLDKGIEINKDFVLQRAKHLNMLCINAEKLKIIV